MATLWESRVLVTYNDNNTETIAEIRNLSAKLIDLLETHKNIRTDNWQAMMSWEVARLYANAMTEIEWACMWSIKAVCK